MLQSVLFYVMNTSIMGTPCGIGFYWKDRGPRTTVPQGPKKPHLALIPLTSTGRPVNLCWCSSRSCGFERVKGKVSREENVFASCWQHGFAAS